jgi:hypothetical protein
MGMFLVRKIEKATRARRSAGTPLVPFQSFSERIFCEEMNKNKRRRAWLQATANAHHSVMKTKTMVGGRLRIGRWGIVLALVWSMVVLISYFWNAHQAHSLLLDQARAELRANFFKDLTFCRWASRQGGVYVPVTETQQPDPYVDFLPERDVTTPSGRHLTLIDPALMMKQFNELSH